MEPTRTPQEELNETTVTFTVSIGEVRAIFGAIAQSAFSTVMEEITDKINHQIQSHQIPLQTQAEVVRSVVTLTLKVGEINSIFSIINGGSFATVMKPTLDGIQSQVHNQVSPPQPLPQIRFNQPPPLS